MHGSRGRAMVILDDLLEMEGVVAAGEFADDGRLLNDRSKVQMSEEIANDLASFCASVTSQFRTLASVMARTTGMYWLPLRGWMYSGGDWAAVIAGNRRVFVEGSKVDYTPILNALLSR